LRLRPCATPADQFAAKAQKAEPCLELARQFLLLAIVPGFHEVDERGKLPRLTSQAETARLCSLVWSCCALVERLAEAREKLVRELVSRRLDHPASKGGQLAAQRSVRGVGEDSAAVFRNEFHFGGPFCKARNATRALAGKHARLRRNHIGKLNVTLEAC